MAAASAIGPDVVGHARPSTVARTGPGTSVTSATSQPPSQRAMTIVGNRTGDSHVKANVPARRSAPSTASPMTRQVSGTHEAEQALFRHDGERLARAGVSASVPSHANSSAPRHGRTTPHQRRAGRQARSV